MTVPAVVPGARPVATRRHHDTWRDLRARRGLSLRELERRTGINRGDLSKIDRGRLAATPSQAAAILRELTDVG